MTLLLYWQSTAMTTESFAFLFHVAKFYEPHSADDMVKCQIILSGIKRGLKNLNCYKLVLFCKMYMYMMYVSVTRSLMFVTQGTSGYVIFGCCPHLSITSWHNLDSFLAFPGSELWLGPCLCLSHDKGQRQDGIKRVPDWNVTHGWPSQQGSLLGVSLRVIFVRGRSKIHTHLFLMHNTNTIISCSN